MRTALSLGIVVFLASVLHGAEPATRPSDPADISADSIVLEVLPPDWIKHAADPLPLWQHEVGRQIVQLKDPKLIQQVLQNPGNKELRSGLIEAGEARSKVVRARIVPGTTLIELSVDRAVADEMTSVLAQAIANQLIENQREAAQNRVQERAISLKNRKQRLLMQVQRLNDAIRESLLASGPATQPSRAGETAVQRDRLDEMRDERKNKRAQLEEIDKQLDELAFESENVRSELRVLLKSAK